MIEDELRAAFARHEDLVPPAGPVREAIDRQAVRARRRRLAVRASGAALAVLAIAGTPVVARGLSGADANPVDVGVAAPRTEPAPTGPLNFLLLGLDRRAGSTAPPRADMVFVVHVPSSGDRAYLIAVPRDTKVTIPAYGPSRYPGGVGKLNEAFTHGSDRHGQPADLTGGTELTKAVLGAYTGLRFDGAATVEFAALREITDAVGGVRMCLDRVVRSYHTKRVFPVGCQRLDGAGAVDLLRQRYSLPDGAYGRDRHGADYVAALAKEVATGGLLTDPARVDRLLATTGLGLDVASEELPALLLRLAKIPPQALTGVTLKAGQEQRGNRVYEVPDPKLTRELFAAAGADRLADFLTGHPELVNRQR